MAEGFGLTGCRMSATDRMAGAIGGWSAKEGTPSVPARLCCVADVRTARSAYRCVHAGWHAVPLGYFGYLHCMAPCEPCVETGFPQPRDCATLTSDGGAAIRSPVPTTTARKISSRRARHGESRGKTGVAPCDAPECSAPFGELIDQTASSPCKRTRRDAAQSHAEDVLLEVAAAASRAGHSVDFLPYNERSPPRVTGRRRCSSTGSFATSRPSRTRNRVRIASRSMRIPASTGLRSTSTR